MEWLPLLRILRRPLFWMAIVSYTLLPGSSYMLIAQATLKLSLPGRGVLARRLKRYLRIIYTSPQRVLLVCSLDFILTSSITVTILAIILNFLNS